MRASVGTLLVRPLAACLSGDALRSFYAATDLTPEILADGDARISPSQLCVAWAEAIASTGNPALALAIAAGTPPGAFGVVEYVCRSAPTLRAALGYWVRYLSLLDDAVAVGLVEERGGAALRVLRESEAPAPASHELCFALVVLRARAMSSASFRASRVCFAHPAPAALLGRYEAFLETEVVFDAPRTELVLADDVLDAALVTADPHLLDVLRDSADRLRERASDLPPLTEQVQRLVQGSLTQEDTQLEAVARRLGLTGRSLQRRLKDEGTAFQAVRDRTRMGLADRYLRKGLSLSEIAFLLGFSEPSAFFRAFKRWTGVTPLERRATLQAA